MSLKISRLEKVAPSLALNLNVGSTFELLHANSVVSMLAIVNRNVLWSPGRLAERTMLCCYHNCVISCVIAWPGSPGLRPCTGPFMQKCHRSFIECALDDLKKF